jgi:Autotransporter beta-domain
MFTHATIDFKHVKVAMLASAALLFVMDAVPAKADDIANRIIQNVIQNILQDVRDQIQSRRLAPSPYPGRLQFTGEDANASASSGDPFAALAYAKAPYAPPPAPAPTYLYGINVVGSGDWSRTAGITTNSAGLTGAFDVTKIGVFSQYDAVTVILTGSGIWSDALGLNSNTGVGAGTVAYVNGGFSGDFTIDGTWTRARLIQAGVVTSNTDSTGVSYAPNVHYKFDLANNWYVEPTVGVSYTQAFTANFGTQTGDSTTVSGGARFGGDTTWSGVRVQPSLTLEAFSIVEQTTTAGTGGTTIIAGIPVPTSGSVSSGGIPTGAVGGRASGKLNVLWTPTFSSYFEAHGSVISSTDAYGVSAGLRWTF